MRPCKILIAGVLVLLGSSPLTAAQATAAPAGERLRHLTGSAEVRSGEHDVVITLRERDGFLIHVFRVETSGQPQALSLRTSSAHVLLEGQHLTLIAPPERAMFRFSIGQGRDLDRLPFAVSGQRFPDDLTARERRAWREYEITQVTGATALISWSGPEALLGGEEGGLRHVFARDIDYDDPGGGGGGGGASCGTSCSTSCGDGSSCSASCQPPRCAKCSCPALCECTL
jgi:hypothetical protein